MSLRNQQKCKWAERGRAGDPSRSSRTFGHKHWTKAPQEFLMWHQPITVLQLLKAQSQHQLPTHQLINTGMQNLPFVENVRSKTHGTPYLSIWIYQKVHAVPTSKKSHLEMLLLAYRFAEWLSPPTSGVGITNGPWIAHASSASIIMSSTHGCCWSAVEASLGRTNPSLFDIGFLD